MSRDGVEILCLPDEAKCSIDEKKRNPIEIEECPLGYKECSGDCEYYIEE